MLARGTVVPGAIGMANQVQFINFVQRFVSAIAIAPVREVVRSREPLAKRERPAPPRAANGNRLAG